MVKVADPIIRSKKKSYRKRKYEPIPDELRDDYYEGRKTIKEICSELNISYFVFWKRLKYNEEIM